MSTVRSVSQKASRRASSNVSGVNSLPFGGGTHTPANAITYKNETVTYKATVVTYPGA